MGARNIDDGFSLLAQETTNYHLSDVTGVKNVEIFLACGCRTKKSPKLLVQPHFISDGVLGSPLTRY